MTPGPSTRAYTCAYVGAAGQVADAYRPEQCAWPWTERNLRHGTDRVKSANRRSLKGIFRTDTSRTGSMPSAVRALHAAGLDSEQAYAEA